MKLRRKQWDYDMKRICPQVFVGNQADFEQDVSRRRNWYVVHACKEPYHRDLLGYKGRGAPKTHPEYLFAKRPDALFLNLIDANDPKYIPKEVIDVALRQVLQKSKAGINILIHCNQGESRGPTIGILYLNGLGMYSDDSYSTAKIKFTKLYPGFNPATGMELFAKKYWQAYKCCLETNA